MCLSTLTTQCFPNSAKKKSRQKNLRLLCKAEKEAHHFLPMIGPSPSTRRDDAIPRKTPCLQHSVSSLPIPHRTPYNRKSKPKNSTHPTVTSPPLTPRQDGSHELPYRGLNLVSVCQMAPPHGLARVPANRPSRIRANNPRTRSVGGDVMHVPAITRANAANWEEARRTTQKENKRVGNLDSETGTKTQFMHRQPFLQAVAPSGAH
jgi:hypothetical protein